jgi:hypothetical protein
MTKEGGRHDKNEGGLRVEGTVVGSVGYQPLMGAGAVF